jgi:spermidine/putrescine transport system permease protein
MSVWFQNFFKRNRIGLSLFLLIAVFVWVVLMIVLPQLLMLDFSFRFNWHHMNPSKMGGPDDVYTLTHYKFLVYGSPNNPDPFNIVDVTVFFRTILAAIFVTMFDLALCYPIAYYLAQVAKGARARFLVVALIVPFWVNEILRAFAFRILFGEEGSLNSLLLAIGLLDEPVDFIRENVALYAGLGYAYVLLMIFPIYNAVESLDRNQIEAARDLGAGWFRIHRRIVMPFAKPGITSGCTMVFMLTAGALALPQIIGGPSSLWFTQIIYQWFNTGSNWPRGSAYAIVLLISCVVLLLFLMRLFKVRIGEIGR